ncbi:MAG: TonB-dependent receptor [Candidatus Margulisbacteria bacterium]|nr:TonB-dependent receptor [Candidatus Margulisiibacteriota bacterium]MBU1617233.1 TonB-dependent receptor [Candidatus Margulisiibacteriota bacterium]MBU1867484.1 TonB-dependent receptor [Candidatus Margulisiibacteriota bacterium]
MKNIILFGLVFFCFTFMTAQDSFAAAPIFYGQEVLVTGSRFPQPVTLIPWNATIISQIQLKDFTNVGEAVRNVAGLDVTSYGYLGAVTSARLRGANSTQVLVLLDGRRLNSPTLGTFDLGDILTSSIDRVEIVRSPLSALYGSDAVSGVINIITKEPKDERYISVTNSSYGTWQYGVKIGGGNYLLTADYIQSDGFRQNSAYAARNVYGKFTLPLGFADIIVDGSLYDALKGIPGVPTSESDPASATEPSDRQADRNITIGAALRNDDFSLRAYANTLDQKIDPYIFGVSSNKGWRNGLEWQQNLNVGLGKTLYGIELIEDRGESTLAGAHSVSNYAAFVQDEILFGRTLFSLSVRGDRHSTAGTSINPRAGLTYQLGRNLALKLSAGSAFRAPTLNELYWNDPAWGMFGNASLKPEKSTSYNIALERNISDRQIVRVSYYQANLTDMILWSYDPATFQTLATNIGEVQSNGVEFDLEHKFATGKGYANYTYQQVVDKKVAVDKQVPYTPRSKYNVGLIMGGSSILARYVGSRYVDSQNTIELPAYTVVDFHLTRPLFGAEAVFAANNVFDEQYSEAFGLDPNTYAMRKYPMPGRNYSLGVKWTF